MNEGTTHWEGCWREHHECAVAEIERLLEEIDRRKRAAMEILEAIRESNRELAREVQFP